MAKKHRDTTVPPLQVSFEDVPTDAAAPGWRCLYPQEEVS